MNHLKAQTQRLSARVVPTGSPKRSSRWGAVGAWSGEVLESRDDFDRSSAAGRLALGGVGLDPHLRMLGHPTERPVLHGQSVGQVVVDIGPVHLEGDDVDVRAVARGEVVLQGASDHRYANLLSAVTRCSRCYTLYYILLTLSMLRAKEESNPVPDRKLNKCKKTPESGRLLICKTKMVRERGVEPPRHCWH